MQSCLILSTSVNGRETGERDEMVDRITALFGGFETALENLSEPRQKILLHSAHDVYIPLSPLSLSKPVPVLQFFFALQAAKKGQELQVPNLNPALESYNSHYCPNEKFH